MEIQAFAPSRIDLAGGTLDLYPLYLFEDGGITVNMGISVGSHLRLIPRADDEIHLRSEDTGAEQSAPSVDELELGGPLDLMARIIHFYRPATGLDVYSRNDAPHGSGLGASSSLLIALSGALRELNQATDLTDEQIVQYGSCLEAQNIRVPTGRQDYYAALYGGINAIWFEVEGDEVERLEVSEQFMGDLEELLVLSFTGETHFSGTSNWNMMKMYIENQGTTVQNMKMIKQTALAMREACQSEDLDRFAELLDQEWQNRRRLAEGVSTPQIEQLMAAAREAGARASKICGAGGGGCMITLAAPGATQAVIAALESNGAEHLPYTIDREGLTVTTT